MKKIVLSLIAAPAVAFSSGLDLTLYNAQRYGAEAKFVLRVVDQDGVPVVHARIFGGIQTGGGLNDNVPVRGFTDTNGEYKVQGKCTGRIRCGVFKEGYYASDFIVKYPDNKSQKTVENGKWMPYGTVSTVVLKRIIHPCRLTCDDGSCKEFPKLGEWIGYDLELNQWVRPYGNGQHSDMLLKICIDAVNDTSNFKTSMEVSFTNNPYGGAYKLTKDPCSQMKTIYMADTNAVYQPSFVFLHERHPIVKQAHFAYTEGIKEIDTRLDDLSYLVIRTRTKVDANGNLVSAHYGKIYGLWEFFGSMRASRIQFNSKPNDPNLEDVDAARYSRMLIRQTEEQIQQERLR